MLSYKTIKSKEQLFLDTAIANMEHDYAENTVLQKFQRYVGLKPIKSEKPPSSFFRARGNENRR